MTSRKKLRLAIEQKSQTITLNKAKLKAHKQYFTKIADEQKYLLTGLLIPIFLAGWELAKNDSSAAKLKEFAKANAATVITTLSRSFF